MKKRYIVLISAALFLAVVYFFLFHKDKDLRYIPSNADVIALIDIKKLKRKYVADLLQNPSLWSAEKKKGQEKIDFSESGIKVPDYFQIFHLKNTPVSEWYTVVEIQDKEEFYEFLDRQKFIKYESDKFKNAHFFIKIEGEKCILGTSDKSSGNISRSLNDRSGNKVLNADSLMRDGIGSLSFISELRIQNFSIDLNHDNIEIKNNPKSEFPVPLIAELNSKTQFLKAKLDIKEIKNLTHLYGGDLREDSDIQFLKISADLKKINDTIISYGYDENFNEIEKVTYQKIIQPDYCMRFGTADPQKTWNYFLNKNWINAKNQFTGIPFQPNRITKEKNEILIKSVGKVMAPDEKGNQNYIFVKNSPILLASLKNFVSLDEKYLREIEYIFYGNRNHDYYIQIKFKKQKLPLILR